MLLRLRSLSYNLFGAIGRVGGRRCSSGYETLTLLLSLMDDDDDDDDDADDDDA